MPVNIKINKDIGVDVQTPEERDAGRVDVGIDRNVGIDVNPTVSVKITNNNLSTYNFDTNRHYISSTRP
jgi:hypothetical protein